MAIKGLDGLTTADLHAEVSRGGRFVRFQYCASAILISFKRSSDHIYFIRAGESAVIKGLPFTGVSLVLGWWGIPWGPIFTVMAIWTNFAGGNDITKEVMAQLTAGSEGTST